MISGNSMLYLILIATLSHEWRTLSRGWGRPDLFQCWTWTKTIGRSPSYWVLPFGLQQTRQHSRLMGSVLRCPPHDYHDDVVIHSATWADHLHHLKEVLGNFTELDYLPTQKNATWGLQRHNTWCSRLAILSCNLKRRRLRPSRAIPSPLQKKQVCAFFGLTGYYRRFVPNVSFLSSPLSDLTRKGEPDKVNESQDCPSWGI